MAGTSSVGGARNGAAVPVEAEQPQAGAAASELVTHAMQVRGYEPHPTRSGFFTGRHQDGQGVWLVQVWIDDDKLWGQKASEDDGAPLSNSDADEPFVFVEDWADYVAKATQARADALYQAFDAAAVGHPRDPSPAGDHVPRSWQLPPGEALVAMPAQPIHDALRDEEARTVGNFLFRAEIEELTHLVLRQRVYRRHRRAAMPDSINSQGVLFSIGSHDFRIIAGHVERRISGKGWGIFLRDAAPAMFDDLSLTDSVDVYNYVRSVNGWRPQDVRKEYNLFIYDATNGCEQTYVIRRGNLCRLDLGGTIGPVSISNLRSSADAWVRAGRHAGSARPSGQSGSFAPAVAIGMPPAGEPVLPTGNKGSSAHHEHVPIKHLPPRPKVEMVSLSLMHGAVHALQPAVRYAVLPKARLHSAAAQLFQGTHSFFKPAAGPLGITQTRVRFR